MDNNLQDIEAVFWDFDGVILNSNEIRDKGFTEVLKEFPEAEVNELLAFHRRNGGLSRYVKFRYFFEEVRNEKVSDDEVLKWAKLFSVIMKELLTDRKLLIPETLKYIKEYYAIVPMYIVSGSDQAELRYLCQTLSISQYFQRIHGSPTPKTNWVKTIVHEEDLSPHKCILVGDSNNDQDAALDNGLHFMGFNNAALEAESTWQLSLKPTQS